MDHFSIGARIVIEENCLLMNPLDGPFPIHGLIVGEMGGPLGSYLVKRDDGREGGGPNGEWCVSKMYPGIVEESIYLSTLSGGVVPIITTDQHMAGISKETIDQEKYDSFMKNLDCGYDRYERNNPEGT